MKPRIDRHHEDPWADTIILNGVRSFRLVIREQAEDMMLETIGLIVIGWLLGVLTCQVLYLWAIRE